MLSASEPAGATASGAGFGPDASATPPPWATRLAAPWALVPIAAFTDNYFWLLHDGASALVVDPGASEPVLNALESLARGSSEQKPVQLRTILVTHHHADHTGGVIDLAAATGAQVVAPAHGRYGFAVHQAVAHGQSINLLGLGFQVLAVPGHTLDHVAYFSDAPSLGAPLLFCGDTLFSGGCGRLFEGSAAQMLSSLRQLAALPHDTQVCCAHEYTLANLRFARAADPHNAQLAAHQAACQTLRLVGGPTLPSTMGLELAINPFLRSHEPALCAAARAHGATSNDPQAVFTALREWKNTYR